MCGFIAQLVEHRTGIAEVMGSNPVEALIFFFFFQASSFQLLNLEIYCDDHTSLSCFFFIAFLVYLLFLSEKFHFTYTFLLSLVKLDMNVSCGFYERLSSAASIVLSLWFASSGLAAVIGNAVVLWLFYKSRSLRTISNTFLASLCVADFLAGLVVDPIYIAISYEKVAFYLKSLTWCGFTQLRLQCLLPFAFLFGIRTS